MIRLKLMKKEWIQMIKGMVGSIICEQFMLLFKKINFRQNTKQLMHIHSFTQAQDPVTYLPYQSNCEYHLLANCMPGKHGTYAWVAGAVLLCEALFCFV